MWWIQTVDCTAVASNTLMYVQVEDIGQGHFGIAKKMIYRPTGEHVAVKFIERGEQVYSNCGHTPGGNVL